MTNRKYTIVIKRDGKLGQLMVPGQTLVSKEAPGIRSRMNAEPFLFIGHVSQDMEHQLPNK